MAKSLYATYLLWACGGAWGLHHLYLGRDLQWLLWFTSWGGFLVGYLTDLYKIPSYVGEANHNHQYMERFNVYRGSMVREFQPARFIGAYVFASYYEFVFVYAVDSLVPLFFQLAFKAVGRGLGMYLCFSIGEKKTSFRYIAITSIASEVLVRVLYWFFFPRKSISALHGKIDLAMAIGFIPMILTGIVAFGMQRYREHIVRKHMCFRLPVLSATAILWLLVISSALYHHLDIPSPGRSNDVVGVQKNRKLKHVVTDFVQSDTYKDMKTTIALFRENAQKKGVVVAWNDLVGQLKSIDDGDCCWEDARKGVLEDTSNFDPRYSAFIRIFGQKRTSECPTKK